MKNNLTLRTSCQILVVIFRRYNLFHKIRDGFQQKWAINSRRRDFQTINIFSENSPAGLDSPITYFPFPSAGKIERYRKCIKRPTDITDITLK